jgi:carboxypeptidase PM20D1
MIRTTTAPTIFEAGTRDNVLPSRARAVVNFRILPGDSVQGVLQHVTRVIADPAVSVGAAEQGWAPSQVSSTDSEYYQVLHETILRAVPGAIVAPYLVLGATDARHYRQLSDNVYRFLPITMNPADLERMHGTDERIGVEDYHRAVLFYRLLIAELAGSAIGTSGVGRQESGRNRLP